MQNEIFDKLLAALSAYLGTPVALDTGHGVRFKSAAKGKATLYHANVATGNQAEVAFEIISMAKRMGIGEGEFRTLIADLRAKTGRTVDPNPQHGWPRVGLTSDADIHAICDALAEKLSQPKSNR